MEKSSIAQAYIQILPTTDGISGNLSKELGGAGESAGKEGGSKFAAAFKKIIAAAGIGKVIKESLTQGMDLEQNLGGAEAVFGDYYKSIQKTAKKSYKNLGSSASDYLAAANKIGSLLQGSGIDQSEAVTLTADAMQRAADVASVMGISTESAFEAIAGAAKGNFTMMDNLGVAMNATTLEAYAVEQGMKDFSYSAATNAEKAELAFQMFFEKTSQYEGNFARESKETLSGSLGQMKAALDDMLGNIVLGNDIKPYLSNLMDAVKDFASQAIPAISNVFSTLPTTIISALAELGPEMLSKGIEAISSLVAGISEQTPELLRTVSGLAENIATTFIDATPKLAEAGSNIISSISTGIAVSVPQLLDSLPDVGSNIVNSLKKAVPQIADSAQRAYFSILFSAEYAKNRIKEKMLEIGAEIINAIDGYVSSVKEAAQNLFSKIVDEATRIEAQVKSAVSNAVTNAIDTIKDFAGNVASEAKKLFDPIVTAAASIASPVVSAVKDAITKAIDAVKEFVGKMADAGRDLLLGLADGIGNAIGSVIARAKEAASRIVSSVKSFFGIASPSKLFRDEVGQFLMLGLAEGITDNTDAVSDAIDDVTMMTTKGFESNLGVNAALGVSTDAEATGGLNQLIGLVAELSDKIDRLRLYLDSGELVGGITTDMDNALGNRDALTARGVA